MIASMFVAGVHPALAWARGAAAAPFGSAITTAIAVAASTAGSPSRVRFIFCTSQVAVPEHGQARSRPRRLNPTRGELGSAASQRARTRKVAASLALWPSALTKESVRW